MELQRHLMLMYTSCGWFFDELSGLETVQVIQYACRAVQLSRGGAWAIMWKKAFWKGWHRPRAIFRNTGTAPCIYHKFARPAAVDLGKLAAHYRHHLAFQAVRGTCPYLLLLGGPGGPPEHWRRAA